MDYNLKETKETEAETLEHCLTVIHSFLQDSSELFTIHQQKKAEEKWQKALIYLKRYIQELFNQQIEDKISKETEVNFYKKVFK